MWPAQNDRDAAPPESGGQLVSVGGARRVEGDGNQIGGDIQINGFCCLIHMKHLPVRRDKSGQVRHGYWLKIENPRAAHPLDFG